MELTPRRASVRLGRGCDNHCVFCGQAGAGAAAIDARVGPALEAGGAAPDSPEGHALLARLRARVDRVSFVGGEPTLDAALPGWISAARAAGFSRIGLQTHGRAPGLARLREAGLTDLQLSLHAADPAAHDFLVGAPGALRAATATLRAARELSLRTGVVTVLARSNLRVLAGLPGLLADLGAAAWLVAAPALAGRAAAIDGVAPRLALALPHALQAIAHAQRLGVPALLSGAPLCLLGPLRARALPPALDPRPRAYADACEGCPARAACPGVDPAYLRRFGGAELSPRALRPAAGDPVDPELADLFVGPGLLEPGAEDMSQKPGPVRLSVLRAEGASG